MISKGSQFILAFLITLVLISVAATYWNTMVLKDFVVVNDLDEDSSLDEESETP